MPTPQRDTAVLVIHGFTAQPRTVEHLGVHLARAGYPFAIPTLRGHGTRCEDLEGVTWADWLADAEAAHAALARHHAGVALVGHSMGGVIAARLAARFPATPALVLVAPAFVINNPFIGLLPVVRPFMRYAGGPPSVGDAEMLAAAAGANYARFPTAALMQLVALGRAVRPELARVRCPSLLLHPRGDRTVREVASEIALRLLGSADKRLEWLEDIGHDVFLDRGRDAVCERIVGFLDEKLAAPPATVAARRGFIA